MALLTANNQSMTAITALPSAVAKGGLVLLETQTASSDATISFTSNIDSTYKEYIFKFYDIHPETDDVDFSFQANAAGGSGYNETITSTAFRTYHHEDDTSTALGYRTADDQAQGTAFQNLIDDVGNDNDQNGSGYLRLFNPSSTTFVKHFMAEMNYTQGSEEGIHPFVAGCFNTTSAIDEIQFKFSSGEIQAGTISLYGIN